MIKGKYRIDARRARDKFRRWMQQVDAATLRDLKLYGAEASKAMMRCTPPGNLRQKPAAALRALKDRIRRDFEGDGLKPFDDDDIFWFTTANGDRVARFNDYNGGRPSPFRVISGRVSKKMLKAMNVGRYRVQFVQSDLSSWMKKSGTRSWYYMDREYNTYRLKWRGTRHVTTMAAVRAEIRRRQALAGSLMAGWKPLAHKAGTRLPAAVERQQGRGSATVQRSAMHKATLTGKNGGHYPELQHLVNRQIPWLRKKNARLAKKRAGKMIKR